MTPRFVFRPRAAAQLRKARGWYGTQAVGLDLEFARAVEAAVAAIGRYPEAYPEVKPRIRRICCADFRMGSTTQLSQTESSCTRATIYAVSRRAGDRVADG